MEGNPEPPGCRTWQCTSTASSSGAVGAGRDQDRLPSLCPCPLTKAQKLLVPHGLCCTRAAGICSKLFKNNIPNQGKCCSLADFSKCFEICFREGRKRAELRAKFPWELTIVTILGILTASVEKVGLYLGEIATIHTEKAQFSWVACTCLDCSVHPTFAGRICPSMHRSSYCKMQDYLFENCFENKSCRSELFNWVGLFIIIKCTVSGHEAISFQENATNTECCGVIDVMQVHHTHPPSALASCRGVSQALRLLDCSSTWANTYGHGLGGE